MAKDAKCNLLPGRGALRGALRLPARRRRISPLSAVGEPGERGPRQPWPQLVGAGRRSAGVTCLRPEKGLPGAAAPKHEGMVAHVKASAPRFTCQLKALPLNV